MSTNVLPDMDEPKMKTLGKQLNRSRKSSIIYHDKLKDQLGIYTRSVDKAKRSLAGKHQINSVRLKKHLAQVRGTQKVLHRKREQTFYEDSDEYPYGVYEGEKLDSYRREIDEIIKHKHPKERRMRKVDKYMKTAKITGHILDEEDARIQFEMIMRKDLKDGYASRFLRREHPLGMTFVQDRQTRTPSSPRPTASPFTQTVSKDIFSEESGSVFEGNITPNSSPTRLQLPPITAGKDFVKYNMKQPSKFSLPNLQIRRSTKADIKANLKPLPSTFERLGKRRATTFI